MGAKCILCSYHCLLSFRRIVVRVFCVWCYDPTLHCHDKDKKCEERSSLGDREGKYLFAVARIEYNLQCIFFIKTRKRHIYTLHTFIA